MAVARADAAALLAWSRSNTRGRQPEGRSVGLSLLQGMLSGGDRAEEIPRRATVRGWGMDFGSDYFGLGGMLSQVSDFPL
jgi:hypothetical protein